MNVNWSIVGISVACSVFVTIAMFVLMNWSDLKLIRHFKKERAEQEQKRG